MVRSARAASSRRWQTLAILRIIICSTNHELRGLLQESTCWIRQFRTSSRRSRVTTTGADFLRLPRPAKRWARVTKWTGVQGRILAARLARRLGDPRLACVLRYLAWRENPDSVDATVAIVEARLARGKYVAAWFFLKERDDAVNLDTDSDVVQWNVSKAEVLALLGDFERADACLAQAATRAPDDPWLWTARAQVLALQDRHDEALDVAKHALEIQPWYVPAVQSVAHQLSLQNRDGEALELLNGARRATRMRRCDAATGRCVR